MHKSLITPPEIDSLAGQVLRQLQGQTYVNAMYALEVAQRQLANELTKLTDQHVFRPNSSQCSVPTGSA